MAKERSVIRKRYSEDDIRANAERMKGRDIELPTQMELANYRAEKLDMDFQVGDNRWVKKIQDKHLTRNMYIVFGSPGSGKDTVREHVLKEDGIEGFVKDTTRALRKKELFKLEEDDRGYLADGTAPREFIRIINEKVNDYNSKRENRGKEAPHLPKESPIKKIDNGKWEIGRREDKLVFEVEDTKEGLKTYWKNEFEGISYNFHPTKIEEDTDKLADARKKGLLSYKYNNHYYWFDAEKLYEKLSEGKKIVLVVGGGTPQEAEELKDLVPDVTTMFVSPPEEKGRKPVDVIVDRYVNRCKQDGTLERSPDVVEQRKRIIRDNYNAGVRVADHVIWNPSEPDEKKRGLEGAKQIMGIIRERQAQEG
ncbi:MAG: hypothetical protein V1921_08395 [Candidatus Altiarchaeota archaeon]